MYVFKRNQIIVTALVIMIAIAGYLNYADRVPGSDDELVFNEDEFEMTQGIVPNENGSGSTLALDEETDKKDETNTDDENESADATMEASSISTDQPSTTTAKTEENGDSEPGAAVFVNSTSIDTPYFVTAKLEREQVRAKRKEDLNAIINNKNIEKDKKAEAADELLELQARVEKEAATESMIEAKGFEEVFVRISEAGVDVIVDTPVLSEAELAQIEQIVRRQTGANADQIIISPLKSKN